MQVIFLLITISLILAGGFLIAFIISASNGQFNDTYTPSIRMLFDEKTDQDNNEEAKK